LPRAEPLLGVNEADIAAVALSGEAKLLARTLDFVAFGHRYDAQRQSSGARTQ
jgi:hypothetical protein